MSYILDALKRADAERGRGTVPGLHAQPMPGIAPQRNSTQSGRRGWFAAAAVLVLAGVAAGIWLWRSPAAGNGSPVRAVTAPVQTPMPSPDPSQATVATAPAASPAPQLAVSQVPPVVPASPAVPPNPVEPALEAAPVGAAPPKAVATKPAPPKSMAPKPAATTALSTPAKSEPAPPTPERSASAAIAATKPAFSASAVRVTPVIAPLLSELPEEIRRMIPALAITGAVYSENPAQRLLLVNGLVALQGATAAPGVVIEEIRSRSATFTFRGSRFRITY